MPKREALIPAYRAARMRSAVACALMVEQDKYPYGLDRIKVGKVYGAAHWACDILDRIVDEHHSRAAGTA